MNLFILHEDPAISATYHCDKHVIKMILESAQLLCSTLNILGHDSPYKTTHKNHPCRIWCGESLSNYRYVYQYCRWLNNEYIWRYNPEVEHKSWTAVKDLPEPDNLEDKGLTPFPQCMPDKYKRESAVEAYRQYYKADKAYMATWDKGVAEPWWWSKTKVPV